MLDGEAIAQRADDPPDFTLVLVVVVHDDVANRMPVSTLVTVTAAPGDDGPGRVSDFTRDGGGVLLCTRGRRREDQDKEPAVCTPPHPLGADFVRPPDRTLDLRCNRNVTMACRTCECGGLVSRHNTDELLATPRFRCFTPVQRNASYPTILLPLCYASSANLCRYRLEETDSSYANKSVGTSRAGWTTTNPRRAAAATASVRLVAPSLSKSVVNSSSI